MSSRFRPGSPGKTRMLCKGWIIGFNPENLFLFNFFGFFRNVDLFDLIVHSFVYLQSTSIARSQGLVKSLCGSSSCNFLLAWLHISCTECINSSVSRFGQKLLWKFPRPVGHSTSTVQPGKKKIARGTSTKTLYQTLRPSYWRTLYILDSSSKYLLFVSIEHVLSTE